MYAWVKKNKPPLLEFPVESKDHPLTLPHVSSTHKGSVKRYRRRGKATCVSIAQSGFEQ